MGCCFPFDHDPRIIYMCVGLGFFFPLKKYPSREYLTSPGTSVSSLLFKVKRK